MNPEVRKRNNKLLTWIILAICLRMFYLSSSMLNIMFITYTAYKSRIAIYIQNTTGIFNKFSVINKNVQEIDDNTFPANNHTTTLFLQPYLQEVKIDV